MIENKDIQAVVICSPTPTHADFIKQAAKAGKHVFCEKPLELSIKAIQEISEVVDKNDVNLMVGFNKRFDPDFSKVRQTIAQGKLGTLQLLRITSRDPEPPPIKYVKSSGGIFLDMAIHDFDMARFIINSEVKEVFAIGMVYDAEIEKAGDIDTAITTLYFENGVIGAIDNSRKAVYGYDQRLEVLGSQGMAVVDNVKTDNQIIYDPKGSNAALPLSFFLERYKQAYINEMQAFITAVLNKEPSPVGAHDGLMSVAIALAAKKSWMEKKPICIKEILNL